MREQTNVLAAEYHSLTGNDPDGFKFIEPEPEPEANGRKTIDGRDVEELRKTWGLGADAAAGQVAAVSMSKAAK